MIISFKKTDGCKWGQIEYMNKNNCTIKLSLINVAIIAPSINATFVHHYKSTI